MLGGGEGFFRPGTPGGADRSPPARPQKHPKYFSRPGTPGGADRFPPARPGKTKKNDVHLFFLVEPTPEVTRERTGAQKALTCACDFSAGIFGRKKLPRSRVEQIPPAAARPAPPCDKHCSRTHVNSAAAGGAARRRQNKSRGLSKSKSKMI